MSDEDVIKEFENTEEYKAWQGTLLSIIGFLNDEKRDDDELAEELMADHLNASLELQKGLEKARFAADKILNEQIKAELRDE
ncbi:MAG: hypothetical protein ACXVHO_09675 [Methanobacterium sp.]